jgi:sec-independent protein translocase protein TatA
MELFTPGHLIPLLVVAGLLFFGWKQLPDMARSVGRSLRIFKTEMKGMTEDDKARAQAAAPPPPTAPLPAVAPPPVAPPQVVAPPPVAAPPLPVPPVQTPPAPADRPVPSQNSGSTSTAATSSSADVAPQPNQPDVADKSHLRAR